MGSELYAYFTFEGEQARSAELDELAADSGMADVPHAGEEGRVVARLSPESDVKAGSSQRLWLDAERLHLFDLESGARLSGPEAGATTEGVGARRA